MACRFNGRLSTPKGALGSRTSHKPGEGGEALTTGYQGQLCVWSKSKKGIDEL